MESTLSPDSSPVQAWPLTVPAAWYWVGRVQWVGHGSANTDEILKDATKLCRHVELGSQ